MTKVNVEIKLVKSDKKIDELRKSIEVFDSSVFLTPVFICLNSTERSVYKIKTTLSTEQLRCVQGVIHAVTLHESVEIQPEPENEIINIPIKLPSPVCPAVNVPANTQRSYNPVTDL